MIGIKIIHGSIQSNVILIKELKILPVKAVGITNAIIKKVNGTGLTNNTVALIKVFDI